MTLLNSCVYRLVLDEMQLLLLGHTAVATERQPTNLVHSALRVCMQGLK